jgi:SAM-dependent methyltransferase
MRFLSPNTVARVGDLLDLTFYDRRLGVETGAALDLHSTNPENQPYLPARWWVLPRLLELLRLDADDVLVDAGCGKGRMVLVAARDYELKRVIGFDFQPKLIEVARANAARLRRLRAPVELLVADAASWTVPSDVTAIYLNHPFRGVVLDAFLDRVLDSYDRRPRRLRLLYLYPFNRAQLEANRRFRLVWSRDGPVRKRPARLYEVR